MALTSSNVPDIPSNDLVQTLLPVVQQHRATHPPASSAAEGDSMDVDPPPTSASEPGAVPSLPSFLSLAVSYEAQSISATAASLRAGVRRSFFDLEDACTVLEILVQWVRQHVDCLSTPSDAPSDQVPDLSSILSFLLPFLDSTFILLSSSSSAAATRSQALLRTLSAVVDKSVGTISEVERGAGVLGEFLRRLERVEASRKAAGEKDAGKEDWRGRRARAREEQVGMVGKYHLEELVL